MSNEEILQKAFLKAKKNGFNAPEGKMLVQKQDIKFYNILEHYARIGMIMSNDFAKAFFGGEETFYDDVYECSHGDYYNYGLPAWQYHLQQMVVSDNPIKYLESYL